jgi:phage terminase large subunit GpA-like protein
MPGMFRVALAPYQTEPMNAPMDDSVQTVVLMWASQTGKTEIINNLVGYHVDLDPSPILCLQPTLEIAASWSTDRLAPMLRDTPVLKKLIADPKSRDSGNTKLHKKFPGGHITIAGANSPASLAARPIRVVLCDEVDRYPASAGTEGDPISLAQKRSDTFFNSVQVITSTPTLAGVSRIESWLERSDKQQWHCPCPKCGEFQVLKWGQVKWAKDQPETARYECEKCAELLDDAGRIAMVRAGEWRATAPFTGVRGYWLSGLNTMFPPKRGFTGRLHQFAAEFLAAKRGGVETLKSWTNTFLSETWEEEIERIEIAPLMSRIEPYPAECPDGVIALTAAVDVQGDRLECQVVGWGESDEAWAIDLFKIFGSPESPDTWKALDEILTKSFDHESGAVLKIKRAFIDSGFLEQSVYRFVRDRQARGVLAIKGSSEQSAPLWKPPRRVKGHGVGIIGIGGNVAKDILFGRLKQTDVGPRYVHFPEGRGFDETYFAQFRAEEKRTKYVRGFPVFEWKKVAERNEAIDLWAYNIAAIESMRLNLNRERGSIDKQTESKPKPDSREYLLKPDKPKKQPVKNRPRRQGGGFAQSWR